MYKARGQFAVNNGYFFRLGKMIMYFDKKNVEKSWHVSFCKISIMCDFLSRCWRAAQFLREGAPLSTRIETGLGIVVLGQDVAEELILSRVVYSASSSFLETMRPFKWTASIMPSSITNSANALSHSAEVNLSPKVMRECLNISASILPLTSNASKALVMVSSSSAPVNEQDYLAELEKKSRNLDLPPAIFSAKSMTI